MGQCSFGMSSPIWVVLGHWTLKGITGISLKTIDYLGKLTTTKYSLYSLSENIPMAILSFPTTRSPTISSPIPKSESTYLPLIRIQQFSFTRTHSPPSIQFLGQPSLLSGKTSPFLTQLLTFTPAALRSELIRIRLNRYQGANTFGQLLWMLIACIQSFSWRMSMQEVSAKW